jgi:curved DNA-binding protein CbpA
MTKTNIKIEFLKGIETLQELKKVYFKLAKSYHPDRGGNLETMQALNNEYDFMFNLLKSRINYNDFDNYKKSQTDSNTESNTQNYNYTYKEETPDIFKDIVSKIINLSGIELEICGTWLWVSGDTQTHKEILKQTGFKWSKNKFMWYWRHEKYRSANRKNHSINDIRNMYGSTIINNNNENKNNNSENKIKFNPNVLCPV